MAKDWRSAYFQQALSDFELFKHLSDQDDVPLCQKLHYLHMGTEKMSEGFLTPSGTGEFRWSHNAFVQFVKLSPVNTALIQLSNFHSHRQYKAFIIGLLPLVQQIEDLSPEGDPHPNPEYPWMANGIVHSPVEYEFSDLRLTGIRMKKLLSFLDIC